MEIHYGEITVTPKRIEICHGQIDDRVVKYYWDALVSMVKHVGAEVIESDALVKRWPFFPMVIDGIEAYYDYSDFAPITRSGTAAKTIKRVYVTSQRVYYPDLICGADVSFLDWENRPVESASPGDTILHCQTIPKINGVTSVGERRLLARNLLIGAFPQLDCKANYLQPEFFERALECLCSVHIPGAWELC